MPDTCVLFAGVLLFKPLREVPPLGAVLMSMTIPPAPFNVLGVRTLCTDTSDSRGERRRMQPLLCCSLHFGQCPRQGLTRGRKARRSYFSPPFVCRWRRRATTTILRWFEVWSSYRAFREDHPPAIVIMRRETPRFCCNLASGPSGNAIVFSVTRVSLGHASPFKLL